MNAVWRPSPFPWGGWLATDLHWLPYVSNHCKGLLLPVWEGLPQHQRRACSGPSILRAASGTEVQRAGDHIASAMTGS